MLGHDENNREVNYRGWDAVGYCLDQAGKYALALSIVLPLAIVDGVRKLSSLRRPAQSKLETANN